MTELLITGLHHDLSKKRSFVYVVWKNDLTNGWVWMCPFNALWTICRKKREKR